MLVLTRKPDEVLYIGENMEIEVKVLGVKGDKVSLGITADPKIFPILRKEVKDREMQNKKYKSPYERDEESHEKDDESHEREEKQKPHSDIRRLVEAVQLSTNKENGHKAATEYFEEHSSYHP